jgi:hypothetical protein
MWIWHWKCGLDYRTIWTDHIPDHYKKHPMVCESYMMVPGTYAQMRADYD